MKTTNECRTSETLVLPIGAAETSRLRPGTPIKGTTTLWVRVCNSNPTFYIVDSAVALSKRYYPNKLMGSGGKPEPAHSLHLVNKGDSEGCSFSGATLQPPCPLC
ncbi:MAG TPA: hypothetical protein ACFYEF_01205 [Candidatus Wunengus sp. YC63]